MYRLLIVVGLLVVAYFLLRSAIREFRGRDTRALDAKSLMVQDPVCRMYVPRESAVAASIGGQTYYFCGNECAKTFQSRLSGTAPGS